MTSRKDLILLQKYRDDNYKKLLVDAVVSSVKARVFWAATRGETACRISNGWTVDLDKEEEQVRAQVKELYPDSLIEIATNKMWFFGQMIELYVTVSWA